MFGTFTRPFFKWVDSKIPLEIDDQLAHVRETCNTWGYSEWGYSANWLRRGCAVAAWLYTHYFRVQTFGIKNLPKGKLMLIGNHSSQLAYDGLLVTTAMFMDATPPRFVHAMVDKFMAETPIYSELISRFGQFIGTYENCVRLLNENRCVLVFPEGVKGSGKLIFDRYKLMPFGKGFMEIALETKAPIIPFGFIGGEEMVPSISKMTPIANLLGLPFLPLSPTGILPLPTKCSIYFGKPLLFDNDPLDDEAINKNVEIVKQEVQSLVSQGLKERKSIF